MAAERNLVASLAENRFLAAGVALVIIAVAATVILATGEDENLRSRIAEPGPSTAAEQTSPGTKSRTAPGAAGRSAGVVTAGGGGAAVINRLTGGSATKTCAPKKVNQVGVTDSKITIGQVITDSNQIPQQLKPVHEGLQAFVNVFNRTGGLCRRKLEIMYRNDNLLPSQHVSDTQAVANNSFAFVGNDSLLDFLDYEREPPFQPTVRGGGSFVPDVGGLAFSYGRSQSAWHAGVVGSVSPVLVGGGQFKFYADELKAKGTPCRKAGIVYVREPTRASEDQANLGQVAVEQSWGAGLGKGNSQLYATNLQDPEPAYEALVDRMIADGMNCTFSYIDIQSGIKFVQALNKRGVWPPDKCKLGPTCFRLVWVPFTVYDQKFIKDGGDGARFVSTFIPHVPLTETSNPAIRAYLDALKTVRDARPSTFSIFGFASGLMFVQGLQTCTAAPTRTCLMTALRKMQAFTGGGLLGGTTPFRRTRATYSNFGTFDWKWIFNINISMRVLDRGGKRDFYRINPKSGFTVDTLKVARGTPG